MITGWFLGLLERLGRHEVLVDGFGNVMWRRYYLFYFEKTDKPRWFDWLPNVHINIFESADVENEDEHNHPWSTLSVMVKGSYVESINHSRLRETRALGLAWLSYKDTHRLAKMTAGTTTFFIHGFRRGEWKFHMRPHDVACDFCVQNNDGKCFKKEETLNYERYTKRGDGPQHAFSKIRTVSWERVTPEFRKRLDRRRSALARMAVFKPDSKETNKSAVKRIMFERVK
jgi:hypothetical protein